MYSLPCKSLQGFLYCTAIFYGNFIMFFILNKSFKALFLKKCSWFLYHTPIVLYMICSASIISWLHIIEIIIYFPLKWIVFFGTNIVNFICSRLTRMNDEVMKWLCSKYLKLWPHNRENFIHNKKVKTVIKLKLHKMKVKISIWNKLLSELLIFGKTLAFFLQLKKNSYDFARIIFQNYFPLCSAFYLFFEYFWFYISSI